MTIRLTKTESSTHVTPDSARVVYRVTVEFKTEADANDIARAFENVLLPRFTRDEAIAIVRSIPEFPADRENRDACMVRAGMRAALEALAAAGVFVDAGRFDENHGYSVNERAATARKLDAAGIK